MAQDLYVLATGELVEGSSVAITGSAAVSGMELTKLLNKFPHKVWRSTSLTTVYCEIDLAAAASVYFVWLGYTNFRPGVTQWQIRAADTQAGLTSSPPYDSGTVYALAESGYDSSDYATDWPNGTHALLYAGSGAWTELANRRWWRIDLTDAAHPDGYFQAGRLIIGGASWKPATGPSYGSGIPTERPSRSWSRARGGALFPQASETPTTAEFRFKELTAAEAFALRRVARLRQSHKDVLSMWMGEPGNAEQTMLHGYLTGMDPAKPASFGVYTADVEIESAI